MPTVETPSEWQPDYYDFIEDAKLKGEIKDSRDILKEDWVDFS